MHIINNLLGDLGEARELKQKFLNIAVVNDQQSNAKMVQGRGVGKEKKSLKQYSHSKMQAANSASQTRHELFAATNQTNGFNSLNQVSLNQSLHDLHEHSTSRTHESRLPPAEYASSSLEKSNTLLANLARNGAAEANNNPIKAIQKIILREKPYITEACLPDPVVE